MQKEIEMPNSVASCKIIIGLILLLFTPMLFSISLEDKGCCVDRWDPWWLKSDMWSSDTIMPGYRKRMERHRAFMHSDMAKEYHAQNNPLPPTELTIQKGARLYSLHCANCHGPYGMGAGVEGLGLSPSPALLAYLMQTPMAIDKYMMWTISDGGEQFGTEMPAFKKIIPRNEIWEIITFIRAGFPSSISK
jgi:mono/diheme cytochrome c family protein